MYIISHPGLIFVSLWFVTRSQTDIGSCMRTAELTFVQAFEETRYPLKAIIRLSFIMFISINRIWERWIIL